MKENIKYIVVVVITGILTCLLLYLIKTNTVIYKSSNKTIKILEKYNNNVISAEKTTEDLQKIYENFNLKYCNAKNEYNGVYIHFSNDIANIIDYIKSNSNHENIDKNIINESIMYMKSYKTIF
jgi:hypothetical protein